MAGRALSVAVYSTVPYAEGFIFPSRFTGHACVAVFDRAFAVPNLLWVATAVGLLVIGALVMDTTPGSIFEIGLNAVVLFVASAIVYLGHAAMVLVQKSLGKV